MLLYMYDNIIIKFQKSMKKSVISMISDEAHFSLYPVLFQMFNQH
jgi:hypothetical protein